MSHLLRSPLQSAALSVIAICSACSNPEPPRKEQPPEPQAQQATQLRDAIQAPIDRARAVEPAVLKAARQQQDQIDAQTGG